MKYEEILYPDEKQGSLDCKHDFIKKDHRKDLEMTELNAYFSYFNLTGI